MDPKELIRTIIIMEALYQQSSMVKFDLRQKVKQKFNNFDKQIESLLNELKSIIKNEEDASDYFEMMSILSVEAIRILVDTEDPKKAVSILAAYQSGLDVTIRE